jgi:hypothetical protein
MHKERQQPEEMNRDQLLSEVVQTGTAQILAYFNLDETEFDTIRHSPLFQAIPGHWSRYQALSLLSTKNLEPEEREEFLNNPDNIGSFLTELELGEQDGERVKFTVLQSHLRHKWGYGILLREYENTETYFTIGEIYRIIWGLEPTMPLASPEYSLARHQWAKESDADSELRRYRQETAPEDIQKDILRAERILANLNTERKPARKLALPNGYLSRQEFEIETGTKSPDYYVRSALEVYPDSDRDEWVFQFGAINGYSPKFVAFVKEQVTLADIYGRTMYKKAQEARKYVTLNEDQGLLADLCAYAEEIGLLRTYPIHLVHHNLVVSTKIELDWLQGGGLVILDNYEAAKALVEKAATEKVARQAALEQ